MRFDLILVILLALALCAESGPKKPKNGKKHKKLGKKGGKNGRRRPPPPPPQRPQPSPPQPPPPPPPPPPFRGCISQESETMNWLLKEHIEAEVKRIEEERKVNKTENETGTFKALNMCWLAEMAQVAFKYKGLFPGIEALYYRGNPDFVQLFTNFVERYERTFMKFPPLDVGNQTSVLPFGCNWGHAEVHCVFVTETFFSFVLQLAQLGNRSLKRPSDIFPIQLLKLMESQ